MDSALRLQTALDHREPDRIPLDIGSTKMTGISITAYRNFLSYKGWKDLDEEPVLLDRIQQLGRPSERFLERICVDTRGIFPSSAAGTAGESYSFFTDEWGIGWRMPEENGLYYDLYSSPLSEDPESDILSGYIWPDGADPARFTGMEERISGYSGMHTGVVMHGFTSGVFEMQQRLRGYENALVDLMTDEASAARILDSITDAKIRYWDRALDLAAGRVHVAVEVDDLGTQQSLLVSRELYRKMIMPRHKRLFEYIHQKSPGIKVFVHSCGSVYEVVPDLIDAGADILNPVQTSAAGMDPVRLKKEFGREIAFWGGGADTQHILPRGTPDDVRENVRRNIEALAPGGGFVFNTIHNIQADVPPQNIEAMLETLELYGKY